MLGVGVQRMYNLRNLGEGPGFLPERTPVDVPTQRVGSFLGTRAAGNPEGREVWMRQLQMKAWTGFQPGRETQICGRCPAQCA